MVLAKLDCFGNHSLVEGDFLNRLVKNLALRFFSLLTGSIHKWRVASLQFEQLAFLQKLHRDVVAVLICLSLNLLALAVAVAQLFPLVLHGAHCHLLLLLCDHLLHRLLSSKLLLMLLTKHVWCGWF